MIRKLLLLVSAVSAALALTASTAVADTDDTVTVENWGFHEVVGDNTLAIEVHSGGVETPLLRCQIHWDISFWSDGLGTLNAEGIAASETGSVGACATAEPCSNHSLWDVRLEEEEPLFSDPEFEAHTVFCLENTGTPVSGLPIAIECRFEAATNLIVCDNSILGGAAEVRGTLAISGDLGVTH
jgi:hypothetical protein